MALQKKSSGIPDALRGSAYARYKYKVVLPRTSHFYNNDRPTGKFLGTAGFKCRLDEYVYQEQSVPQERNSDL